MTTQTTESKISSYTCFNDGLKSFLSIVGRDNQPVSQFEHKELHSLFLKYGELTFITDNSTQKIDQFVL